MVGASTGLKIDIELGEFQLYIADVMQEEHQDAYIVVPGEGSGEGETGEVTRGGPPPCTEAPKKGPWAASSQGPFRAILPGQSALPIPPPGQIRGSTQAVLYSPNGSPTWALTFTVLRWPRSFPESSFSSPSPFPRPLALTGLGHSVSRLPTSSPTPPGVYD